MDLNEFKDGEPEVKKRGGRKPSASKAPAAKTKKAVVPEPVEEIDSNMVASSEEPPFDMEVKEYTYEPIEDKNEQTGSDGTDNNPAIGDAVGGDSPIAGGRGRITQVIYKTNKNLGDYQHESVELVSTVGEFEDPEDVFIYLRESAKYYLDELNEDN